MLRKDVAVADLIRWSANQIQWDVIFYKALHDWEQGMMEDFYPLFIPIRLEGMKKALSARCEQKVSSLKSKPSTKCCMLGEQLFFLGRVFER